MGNGFYKGNNLNSIGEPARILIAPHSYPMPTRISEIIGLTAPWAVVGTYGFRDIGFTRTETTMQHQAGANTWSNQQVGEYRRVPTNFTAQVSTAALEMTQQNKVTLMNASAADEVVVGAEHVTHFEALAYFPQYRVAVVHRDDYQNIHATVFPLAQWDGSAVTQTLGRGTQLDIPFTFVCMPDPDVIGVNGYPMFRVDFDQY